MDDIEDHFIVEGDESFVINGEEYILTNAEHFIINGEEYVMIEDELYQVERDGDQDLSEIEDHFIVRGEERYVIHGREYIVTNAEHYVANGEEYVKIGDEFYRVDNNSHAPNAHGGSQQGSILGTIIGYGIGLVILAVIVVVVGGVGTAFVSGFMEGIDSEDVAIPKTTTPETVATTTQTSTPKPTPTTQSYESRFSDQIVEAMDYTNPTTRDYALSLIPQAHGGEYSIAQICDMWEAAYKKWTYVNDPKGTGYLSPASRTIQLGLKGDCDDFAILMGSLIQATGGSARVVTAYKSNGEGHAFAEVYIARDKSALQSAANYICMRYNCKSIAYHTHYDKNQNPQYWLNLDWSANHPGGPFYQASELKAYYSNGYWCNLQPTA